MALILVLGPPAVGKMAVGRELARQGGYRLLHNHALLEPLLEVFDYGSEPFGRLHGELRERIVEEAARAGTDLVLTFVWGLDLEEDAVEYSGYLEAFGSAGAAVHVVELYADLDTRLARNRTELRLDAKPSKRDVAWSEENVRSLEVHRLSTADDLTGPGERVIARYPFLRIDNTLLSAAEAAAEILAWVDGLSTA